jgi:hypothetical protein
VFYVITFVAIPALLLIWPVLTGPNYILSNGVDSRILLGCVLDIVVALTGIGTAVALFPGRRPWWGSLASIPTSPTPTAS